MVPKSWINLITILFLAAILAGVLPDLTAAQNCGCAPHLCCSRWGWCGSTEDYCGPGCQEGPCFPPAEPTNVSIASIVTQAFFDSIINVADPRCPGKNFYSRSVFLHALDLYPLFGREGSIDDSKREIAAFFAHVTHETGHMCHIEEIDGPSRDYCQAGNTQYPCVSGVGYYGRGPLQLSWNYNYGPAGHEIGFNGLHHPEIVATNNVISFKASLWFWMMNVHHIIVSGQGFGETIRAINGMECNGGNPATVHARVQYYTAYCNYFGTSPGDYLYC